LTNLVSNIKQILIKLHEKCSIIYKYNTFLFHCTWDGLVENSEKKGKFDLIFNEDFKNCSIELAEKIFIKYLSLINMVFDESAKTQTNPFVKDLFEENEIINILRNLHLNLEIRTELIKFFRMVYIDVSIITSKMAEYRNEICDLSEPINDFVVVSGSEKAHLFLERIMLISDVKVEVEEDEDSASFSDEEEDGDGNVVIVDKIRTDTSLLIHTNEDSEDQNIQSNNFEFIDFELKSFLQVVDNYREKKPDVLMVYFENGIILPIKIYLSKMFTKVLNMSGLEFLKIYEMAYHLIRVKIFLLKNKKLMLSTFIKKENSGGFFKVTNPVQNDSMINTDIFEENTELERCEKALQDMILTNFKVFDYYAVYVLINEHLDKIIHKSKAKQLLRFESQGFTDQESDEIEKKLQDAGYFDDASGITMFKLIKKYENGKKNLKEGSFINNLKEVHHESEVAYLKLYLEYLYYTSNQLTVVQNLINQNEIILSLILHDTEDAQEAIKLIYEEGKEKKEEEEKKDKKENQIDFININKILVKEKKKLIDFNKICDDFVSLLISVIFCSYNPSFLNIDNDYEDACTIIKIFKFLCENHNEHFHKIFISDLKFDRGNGQMVGFYDFFLCILIKIIDLSKWSTDDNKNDETESDDYYFRLFYCIIELLIEIIQGTPKAIFKDLYEDPQEVKNKKTKTAIGNNWANKEEVATPFLYIFLDEIKKVLFKDNCDSDIVYQVRKNLINFLLAFLEENSCPLHIKTLIVNTYQTQDFITSIIKTLKKYYYKVKININENKNVVQCQDWRDLKFSDELYTFYIDQYYNNEDFPNEHSFQFANIVYKYVKLISLETNFKNDLAQSIFQNTKVKNIGSLINFQNHQTNKIEPISSVRESELIIDDRFFENYFIILLFDSITRVIPVLLEPDKSKKETSSNRITNVIFTIPPKINYITPKSKSEFLDGVIRDTRYTKLYSMLLASDNFTVEIEHNYLTCKDYKILLYLNGLDYLYIEIGIFAIILVLNVFMLFTLTEDDVDTGSELYKHLIDGVQVLIVVLSGFFIVLWFLSKWQCHYSIQKMIYIDNMSNESKKGKDNKEIEDKLTFFQKLDISINHALLQKNEINSLIFITICGLIGLCVQNKKYNFLYSLQLMIVINLAENLKNIRIAIQMRYKQLMATLIFMVLIMYIFSNLNFYFYYEKLMFRDGQLVINQCNTIASCLLSVFLYGLRWHGGFGDTMEKPQLLKDTGYYIGRFFHDLAFFIIIIIFLLNIIFGIIIGTFRDLRINSWKKENDILNKCIICDDDKENIEKQNQSYENHCEVVHNIWSYIYYIILLKGSNPIDLNAVNSYVLENIEKKSIGWIPTKEYNMKSEEDEDEEKEEEEENGEKTEAEEKRKETEEKEKEKVETEESKKYKDTS